MKKIFNKVLASMLVAVMFLTVVPLGEIADIDWSSLFAVKASGLSTSGSCGGNVSYLFDSSTGLLTISGTGEMSNYSCYSNPLFYNDSSIKSVVIEYGVTSIGDEAFYGCCNLTSIKIPDSITNVGSEAFRDCCNLTTVNINDIAKWCSISFFDIYSNPTHYSHGLYINGKVVTDLVIPDGVTSIKGGVFYNCSSLTSITIPDSVTSIGSSAFYNCTGLTRVTIPDSVVSIGSLAFYNCNSLTNIVISNSEIGVHYTAFNNCYALQNIYYSGTQEQWNQINDSNVFPYGTIHYSFVSSGKCGENVFWSVDVSTSILTISGTGEMDDYGYRQDTNSWKYTPWRYYDITGVIISDGVTHIGDGAFQYTGIKKITIPDSVLSIGSSAFDSSNLTSIFIPNNVKSIGWCAFSGCQNLTTLGGKNSGCSIEYDCENIIPEHAFQYSEIEQIFFSENITEIGDYAFANCNRLKNITIPSTIKKIGERAFGDCENIESAIIGEGVFSLAGDVFFNCMNLEYVSLPKSITKIGEFCFSYCPLLTSVGPIGSESSIEFGWTDSILDNAFCAIDNLTEVYLPQSIKYIGSMSFSSNYKLTSIIIPANIKSIGYYAFGWCSSLKDVYFEGKKPAYIDQEAFGNRTINAYYPYGESSWNELPDVSFARINWNMWKFGTVLNINCEYSSQQVYVVGDSLNLDGLFVTAVYDSGYEEIVPVENLNIKCDLSSPGYKEVIVTYKNVESSYMIYVHSEENLSTDKSMYPESAHDYENNATDIQWVNYPGAKEITITFSERTYVEPNIDFIYIEDNNCTYGYTGSQLAGETLTFYSDNICIKLVSDGSDSFYGYSIDNIIAIKPVHYYDNACDDICNYCGFKRSVPHIDENNDGICDDCGKSLSDIVLNEQTNINVSVGETVFLRFIPTTTGIYSFFSSSNLDTYGYIYDKNKNVLTSNDDGGNGSNFSILYTLKEGVIYYLGVKYCSPYSMGMIPVTISLEQEICEHINTHTEHKDASCTEIGYNRTVCDKCGETIEDTVLPFCHNYVWETITNPTINQPGLAEKKCSKCGDVIDTFEIPPLIPNFVSGVTISPKTIVLNVGEMANMSVIVEPDTAINKNIIWSMTADNIATINNGTVTAVNPGSTVIVAETEDGRYKDFCVIRVVSLISTNGSVIDNENGLIYGLSVNTTNITEYVDFVDENISVSSSTSIIGTGSIINVEKDGEIIDTFNAVIFGDVNSDGIYDGTDAIIVNCLANGLLSKEQVGEAVYMAADCNHDGVIDSSDVALLEQAGVLLANVDQSKSSEELVTDSAYVEYLNLIQQSPETESTAENAAEDTPAADKELAQINWFPIFVPFIKMLLKLLNVLFIF